MEYSKILILGVNSSIASFVMPELGFDKDKVYGVSHRAEVINLPWIESKHVFVSDYPFDQKFIRKILKSLAPSATESILVINFAGFFGAPVDIKYFEIDSVIDTLNKNMIQFLSSIKLFSQLPVRSFFIGFSGAGVGGDNLESSSLGYLISKISLAGGIEVLDKSFKDQGKRLTLIAPGAFPSNMQTVVANSLIESVSEEVKVKVTEFELDESKIVKLAKAIDWVSNYPNQAGGKIWSAQRDDFVTQIFSEKFGFLRRVIQ